MAKLLAAALATVISVLSKLVTFSLKVAVTVNKPVTVVAEGDVKLTVGAVKSAVRVN